MRSRGRNGVGGWVGALRWSVLAAGCFALVGAAEAANRCSAASTENNSPKTCSDLSSGGDTCVTVAVVLDTQYLVDGDPDEPNNPGYFSDANSFEFSEDAKDYELFKSLVDFLIGEKTEENIQLVLHAGDIIFAGDGGGVPCDPGAWPLPRACAVPEVCIEGGEWVHAPRTAADGTVCGCQKRRRIRAQWARFLAEWRKLDGEIPYAIVQGNHDNAGRLPTDGAEPGEPDPFWERRDPEDGFFQYFGPAQIRRALTRGNLGPSLGDLVSTYTQSRSSSDHPSARRGTSHAWRFNLAGRPVGVLGLPWEWGRPDLDPNAPAGLPAHGPDLQWATDVVASPLVGLPLIVLAHQHFHSGLTPSTWRADRPWEVRPSWQSLVDVMSATQTSFGVATSKFLCNRFGATGSE